MCCVRPTKGGPVVCTPAKEEEPLPEVVEAAGSAQEALPSVVPIGPVGEKRAVRKRRTWRQRMCGCFPTLNLDASAKGSIAASVATMVFSIPTLVGSCCWPVLVVGILGGAASATSKSFSHSLTFGITLAVMTNLAQMLFWKCGNRDAPTHLSRFGPLYIAILATCLVMADPVRHVLQDADLWTASHMYRPGCHSDTLKCLSAIGWIFTFFCTYFGYFLLIVAVLWGTDVVPKLRDAWRQIRAATKKANAATSEEDCLVNETDA